MKRVVIMIVNALFGNCAETTSLPLETLEVFVRLGKCDCLEAAAACTVLVLVLLFTFTVTVTVTVIAQSLFKQSKLLNATN